MRDAAAAALAVACVQRFIRAGAQDAQLTQRLQPDLGRVLADAAREHQRVDARQPRAQAEHGLGQPIAEHVDRQRRARIAAGPRLEQRAHVVALTG